MHKQISSEPAGQQSQLTHCWLGMATEVSTSAMAPNIWSVRPWFFCRAFILLNTNRKTPQPRSPIPIFASFMFRVCLLLLFSALSQCTVLQLGAEPTSFYHDTQETSCVRIDQEGGGLVSVWEHAVEQEPQHFLPPPSSTHRWAGCKCLCSLLQ